MTDFIAFMAFFLQVMHAAIIEKRDILGAAETGSGKTLAFGIPLLHHLMEDKARDVTVVGDQDHIKKV